MADSYRLLTKYSEEGDTYFESGVYLIENALTWETIASELVNKHGIRFKNGERFILQNESGHGAAIMDAKLPPDPVLSFKVVK